MEHTASAPHIHTVSVLVEWGHAHSPLEEGELLDPSRMAEEERWRPGGCVPQLAPQPLLAR